MKDWKRIDVGDTVRVLLRMPNTTQDPWIYGEIKYVPNDTGDSWQVLTDDGLTVAFQHYYHMTRFDA